jgi:hypothetical protein
MRVEGDGIDEAGCVARGSWDFPRMYGYGNENGHVGRHCRLTVVAKRGFTICCVGKEEIKAILRKCCPVIGGLDYSDHIG